MLAASADGLLRGHGLNPIRSLDDLDFFEGCAVGLEEEGGEVVVFLRYLHNHRRETSWEVRARRGSRERQWVAVRRALVIPEALGTWLPPR